jgi:hypothetical protein
VETSTHPSGRHNRIGLGTTPRNVMATLLLASTKTTTIKVRNKIRGYKMRENAAKRLFRKALGHRCIANLGRDPGQ